MSARWRSTQHSLTFAFGGFVLGHVRSPARILDIPFHQLSDREPLPPDWASWEDRPAVAAILGQPVAGNLRRLTYAKRSIRYIPSHEIRYWVNLSGSFAEYLRKFSSKSRNSLKRKLRKATEMSGDRIRWQEYRTAGEVPEFHRLACAISARTYQQKLGFGLPDDAAFREQLIALAERDQLRGYLLFHGEHAIAFAYCPAQGSNLIYHRLGFDPEYLQWSPGTVLTYRMLERLFEEQRFSTLDFGQSEFDYKGFYATDQLRCANVLFLRPTLRNILLVGGHLALYLVEAATLAVLRKLGIKAWLKRVLRPHS